MYRTVVALGRRLKLYCIVAFRRTIQCIIMIQIYSTNSLTARMIHICFAVQKTLASLTHIHHTQQQKSYLKVSLVSSFITSYYIYTSTTTMCLVQTLHSPTCHHTWMEITTPCAPDRGFSNCPHLVFNCNSHGRPLVAQVCSASSCPWDGGRAGEYCLNTTRVVTRVRHGVHIGRSPGGRGVDLMCAVM